MSISSDPPVAFPCDSIPPDAANAKLLGVYRMRQEGLYLQRVKLPGGALTSAQLVALARAAERLTPEYPLHFTTRQSVEFHGLAAGDVPLLQHLVADAGLTGLAAAGDTVRNTTVCPGSGLCAGSCDMRPLARELERTANDFPGVWRLPRKFKMSLSGCQRACARPFINDLAFVAQPDGRLKAVVAGSLGARPGTGVEYPEALAAADAVPFAVAALALFEAEGDRANRAKARLRHVRERLGDEVFLGGLAARFDEARRLAREPVRLARAGEGPQLTRLRLPLGDLAPADAAALAESLPARAVMRVGLEGDLWIFGAPAGALPPHLAAFAGRPTVVACPGSAWCSRGMADSRAAALRIAEALPAGCDLLVAVSGCPNNCAHAAIADIGLTGRMATFGGVRTEAYRVVTGGGRGSNARLAEEVGVFPAAGVADEVLRLATAGAGEEPESASEVV